MKKNRVRVYLDQARQYASEGKKEYALDSIRKALAVDPGEMIITEELLAMEHYGKRPSPHKNKDTNHVTVQQSTRERNNTANMDSKLEKAFKLSEEARAAGNNAKALAYLKKAAQLFPDEPEIDRKLEQIKISIKAENLVKIGLIMFSEGDVKKAITASRKVFDLMPEVNGLDDLLEKIETVGDQSSAPEFDSNIPEEEPEPVIDGEAQLWADRIRSAVKDDKFEDAGKMVSEAIKRHPDDRLLNSFYTKLKRLGYTY